VADNGKQKAYIGGGVTDAQRTTSIHLVYIPDDAEYGAQSARSSAPSKAFSSSTNKA